MGVVINPAGGMITPRATPTPGQGGPPDPTAVPAYAPTATPITPAPAAQGWQQALFGQGAVDADARAHVAGAAGNYAGALGQGVSALAQGAGMMVAQPVAMAGTAAGYGLDQVAKTVGAFGRGLFNVPEGQAAPAIVSPAAAVTLPAQASVTTKSVNAGMPGVTPEQAAIVDGYNKRDHLGEYALPLSPADQARNQAVSQRYVGAQQLAGLQNYLTPGGPARVPLAVQERQLALQGTKASQAAGAQTAGLKGALGQAINDRYKTEMLAAKDNTDKQVQAHNNLISGLLAINAPPAIQGYGIQTQNVAP